MTVTRMTLGSVASPFRIITEEEAKATENLFQDWAHASAPNIQLFGLYSMHTLREIYALSEILRSHRPERIVEYGTAHGGVTTLFGLYGFLNKCQVMSLDVVDLTWPYHAELLDLLPVERVLVDEYLQEAYTHVQDFADGKKTLFYCDGGNKPLEFRNCCRIMKDEDIVVTHDFDIDDITGILLPPGPERDVSFVSLEEAQRTIEREGVEVIFEEYLGDAQNNDGTRRTRLLVVRRKIKESDNDRDGISSKECVGSASDGV